jgi:uncharacterized lipoprotein NlpE involved in copper resistance
MKTISKIVLGLAVIVALTGCDNKAKESENVGSRSETMTKIADKMYVFCDKEKGVEYIQFDGYKAGGLTIRKNADGSVSTCK